ncbi:MAG: GNAT family N-acetyltransferase [Clostridia bacterium]|nr:GNAT family N-acetyltransferase [Clostridia bacterium]
MKREKLIKVFSDIPTLKTERLTLRAMRRDDATDMFEYASQDGVTEFLLWSSHKSRAYTEEYLKYVESRYAVGDFYDWALICNQSGKMIGTCGFASIDTVNNVGEIGYVLNPAYHGRGIAAEAAKEVMRFGFETLELHRIEARFMEGNDASRRVMEKLGMSFEGTAREAMLVKGAYRTIGKYAILAKDFSK